MLAWARDASRPSVANPRSSLASAHRLSKAATGSLTPCSKAELLKRMFWNLVVVNYEKYRLHHILLFGLLIVYSDHEDLRNREEVRHLVKQSVAAKKELVERIQAMQYAYPGSPLNITELRKAIDKYDVSMEMKPAIQREKRWDMWGGLYYAGTIYTTIGYGDLVAVTFWGRIFTMIYAVLGIPMVITVLNDWGTLMFHVVDRLWKRKCCSIVDMLKRLFRRQKKGDSEQTGSQTPTYDGPLVGDEEATEPIPLFLVALVLVFWYLLCCVVFSYFERWTFFETIYFFFISLTTIVAVANFLLILVGLSVVSLAINVVQMQLELQFTKVVKSIDEDFKLNLSSGAGEDSKKVGTQGDACDIEKGDVSPYTDNDVDDVVQQYVEGMSSGERILMRFMSHHQ
ncbi:unnamed protein product [Nippostrongylus brasiliensis]|uniref:Ion_trans_2 domain-containing protein n=1 Tax=Nippostrongylus brasiliensis TaxID=27835 RepID=A0A158QZB0_NIPBR|nr:unnamed protein product [Nippostrongylus brasiliensis]